MGKGVIISGGEAGLYQVQVKYNRDRYNATINALNSKVLNLQDKRTPIQVEYNAKAAELDSKKSECLILVSEYRDLVEEYEVYIALRDTLNQQLDELELDLEWLREHGTDEQIAAKELQIEEKKSEIADNEQNIKDTKDAADEKYSEYETAMREANEISLELGVIQSRLNDIDLQIAAVEKRIEYLTTNMPSDETVPAWCADLTTDLSGTVGTIEVPGERGTLQIWPGFAGEAGWYADDDGQLFPTVSMTPAQTFYNLAMKPGWQKWNPTFRHGIITAIDGDYADVTLDNISSSQQSLEINQTDTLSGVEIDYMNCNGGAFVVGDEVLIMFENQRWATPKIIGFKDNPKSCTQYIPYLFASENSFPSGGLLLCNGDAFVLDKIPDEILFSEEYELFSPFGPTSNVATFRYQPYTYNSVTIEWQVKEFEDADGVVWQDVPWMVGGGYDWDPTFYETFLESYEIEKPYDIDFIPGEYVRDGEYPTIDWYAWTRSEELSVNSVNIAYGYDQQWYTGSGENIHWYRSGLSVSNADGALDQTDPSKYFVIYQKRTFSGDTAVLLSENVPVETDETEIWISGLGFNQQVIGVESGDIFQNRIIRLYKIEEQYICLFSFQTTNKKFIGSAVEGGSLTIIDVTGGLFYDGSYRDLFTGSPAITFGIIIKNYVA